MITEQQKQTVIHELIPLLSDEDKRLSVTEKTALRAVLHLAQSEPKLAGLTADGLDMLLRVKGKDKDTDDS